MDHFTESVTANAFKLLLVAHCRQLLEQRIANAVNSMDTAQAAANESEKSSAGDKYETSRAMGQREVALHASQLSANKQELAGLLAIETTAGKLTVGTGSLVECDTCLFFIATGLGKVVVENRLVYLVAPGAPVARMLNGRVAGERVIFNQQTLVIVAVW